jgi:hypothetical protein
LRARFQFAFTKDALFGSRRQRKEVAGRAIRPVKPAKY